MPANGRWDLIRRLKVKYGCRLRFPSLFSFVPQYIKSFLISDKRCQMRHTQTQTHTHTHTHTHKHTRKYVYIYANFRKYAKWQD